MKSYRGCIHNTKKCLIHVLWGTADSSSAFTNSTPAVPSENGLHKNNSL